MIGFNGPAYVKLYAAPLDDEAQPTGPPIGLGWGTVTFAALYDKPHGGRLLSVGADTPGMEFTIRTVDMPPRTRRQFRRLFRDLRGPLPRAIPRHRRRYRR